MPKREVRVGQVFQPVETSYLGRRAPIWEVTGLYTGPDGLGYAKLVNGHDPSLTKTLGVEVLSDSRRFILQGS